MRARHGMTGAEPAPAPRTTLARSVLVIGFGVVAAAALGLVVTGNDEIRYSADHHDTIPLWTVWVPALLGIALVRAVPPRLVAHDPLEGAARPRVAAEAWVCVAAAVGFAALLPVAGGLGDQLGYVVLKLVLLLALPLAVLRAHRASTAGSARSRLGRWYWLGPAVPVAAWFALAYFGPLARSAGPDAADGGAMLLGFMLGSFLVNSVLEEVFYRFWLQTRLERLLGRWPAIVATSLLWAVWHAAIQGTGQPGVDLATVVANQGVTGLFLGYLWSRYRNPWALVLVHGAMNAPLAILTGIL